MKQMNKGTVVAAAAAALFAVGTMATIANAQTTVKCGASTRARWARRRARARMPARVRAGAKPRAPVTARAKAARFSSSPVGYFSQNAK